MQWTLVILLQLFPLRPSLVKASNTIVRGEHSYSSYSTELRGQNVPEKRRRSEARNIIDNQHMKYVLPITVGNQTLNVEIDTGSSDTWLLQTGFECYHTYDNSSQTF